MSTKGIVVGADGDLIVRNGELIISETTVQSVEAVLLTMRGEWKEFPLLGGEAVRQLGGSVDVMWPAEVKEMLQTCGVEAKRVKVEGNSIIVE